MAERGRKGFYEELMKAEQLQVLSGLMVKHANKVMNGDDEARKDSMTHKILPKIIDKAIATQVTGEGGEAIKITVEVAKSVAEKNDIASGTGRDSEGQAQV